MIFRAILIPVMVLLALARPVLAERITVAVASNFLTTAQDIVAAFSAATDHDVDLVHGSTGKLFAQIRAGAPFDVFMSADAARPERLRESGMAVDNRVITYAVGRLALVHGPRTESGELREILLRPGVRIAIADPAVAPYGVAARTVLRDLLGGDWDGNVVFGESVGQAFAFVATGNADLGLVALAQARTFDGTVVGGSDGNGDGDGGGQIWVLEVPGALHEPIRQDAILLPRAADKPAARAFYAFLGSALARAIMRDAGYEVAP